ncbi:MAG: hypothetical protein IJ043_03180 [Clostridia bacterium]|nr:hypothetical protein [Clostridia bacterium]
MNASKYECENCGCVFEEPLICYETHGFPYPPYERIGCCPDCRVAGEYTEVEDG